MRFLMTLMVVGALQASDPHDRYFDSNGVRIRAIRRAHVVGFSMGAFIAGHLMVSQPDRLISVTLVAHHPIRSWTGADQAEAEAWARDLESETPFRLLITAIAPPDARPSEDEIRRRSAAMIAVNDPQALAAYHRGLRTLAVSDADLGAVRLPILAVIGSEDPTTPRMRELPGVLPHLSLEVVEGATHGGDRGILRRAEFLAALRAFLASQRPSDPEEVLRIVHGIQRADYEGNRSALRRLYDELGPFLRDQRIRSRVLYWRGFAMWRRALNGFNDGAPRQELEEDLTRCVADFRSALMDEPQFVDAHIGAASCLINHSFLLLNADRARAGSLFIESRALLNEAMARDPENPRLLWVHGANQWYSPTGGSDAQAAALATYSKGLALARTHKKRAADPLEPSWGEAELLMNLAFANLNRATPDIAAAERYATAALALVPHWHYVRDILLPQIRAAQRR